MPQLLVTFYPIACATDTRESRRLPRITQRDIFNSLTLFNRAPESKRSRASLIFLSDASTVLI